MSFHSKLVSFQCYQYGFEAQPNFKTELETKMKCKKLFELRNCCLPELIRRLSHKHPARKTEYNRLLKKSNPEEECKKVEFAVLKGKAEASRNYKPVDSSNRVCNGKAHGN